MSKDMLITKQYEEIRRLRRENAELSRQNYLLEASRDFLDRWLAQLLQEQEQADNLPPSPRPTDVFIHPN